MWTFDPKLLAESGPKTSDSHPVVEPAPTSPVLPEETRRATAGEPCLNTAS